MRVIPLQSGSNGNCFYVESNGVRLLFDAGISGRQAQQRLAEHDCDITQVNGLLISHDHVDHAKCMGIYHRKFGIPVCLTEPTLQASQRHRLGHIQDLKTFCAGQSLRFEHMVVETIQTPHDGADGVVFVIDDGEHRLGILTDLGHVFDGLVDIIASLDAVVLESNYDPVMLRNGYYPDYLKERISGSGGHLSNLEAAQLLKKAQTDRLRWVCLAHLSEDNNTPELAVETHRSLLGSQLPLVVASRYRSSGILDV